MFVPEQIARLLRIVHRLVYLSSGMHRGVRARMDDLLWTKATLERLVSLRGEQAVRCFAGICRRSPVARRQIQCAGTWMGSDKDGRSFSAGRSASGMRNQVWLATSEDELARSSGGYFYHQRPRAPNPIAADLRTHEELLAECGRISGIPLD